jgi:putative hydrolase of the HAD superfamily
MSLRGVIFDLDDTLTERRLAVRGYAEKFLIEFQERLTITDPTLLAAELIVADHDGYNLRRAEDIALLRIWRSAPEAAQIAAHWSEHFPSCAVLRQHCKETLLALRAQGLRLAVVTNGSASAQHEKLRVLGIHDCFDAIVISEEFGAKKPDPRIFRAALARVELTAAECAFVGDNPEKDVQGASAVGLRAVWLSASLAWPPDMPRPAQQINTLAELLPLLGLTLDPASG